MMPGRIRLSILMLIQIQILILTLPQLLHMLIQNFLKTFIHSSAIVYIVLSFSLASGVP
jgi:hypothetical protein